MMKKMMLLTKAIKKKLIDNHNKTRTEGEPSSHNAVVHLFNPYGRGHWYLSELDPETNIAFGVCCITHAEFGDVSMDEMESLDVGPLGLGIEREYSFPMNKYNLGWCMDYAKKHYGCE